MKYYIDETLTIGEKMNAGNKARNDVQDTIVKTGFEKLHLSTNHENKKSKIDKLLKHMKLYKEWSVFLKDTKAGDIIFLQVPAINHTIFLFKVLKKIRKRGVKVAAIVHDLDCLRYSTGRGKLETVRIKYEDNGLLSNVDYVIAHNDIMKKELEKYVPGDRICSLGIFDYLIDGYEETKMKRNDSKALPIIVAGNLKKEKTGYLYDLPKNLAMNLYGVGYEGEVNDKIKYKGAFLPDELPFNLEGSFGLVWDGETSKTCSGGYGEYLKINNPHKTSLYLASNLPVIIWEKAALANFVKENNCGICVNSLDEIHPKIDQLTDEEYNVMKENAKEIGKRLREGYYLKQAISNMGAYFEQNGSYLQAK